MKSVTTRFPARGRTFVALAVLAAALSGASTSTLAAPASASAPTVRVPYGDLNLASDQGNTTLYARIAAAARQVCFANSADSRDLGQFAQVRACEARAIAQAVREVRSPQLAALSASHQRHG